MKELNSKDIEAVTGGGVPVAVYYAFAIGRAYAAYIGGAAALGTATGYTASYAQHYMDSSSAAAEEAARQAAEEAARQAANGGR